MTIMPINNNHNMLSTSSFKSSSTTTANTIISNNTDTNTTSSCPSSPPAATMVQQQQQQRQMQPQALKCPRCDSSNTKFCYYNNYSLSQPRHFCKACKRYWTRGGTLRNVPVGGGCRKNKRVRKAPATATTAAVSPLPHPSSPTTTTSDHLKSLFFELPSSAAVASNMNLASTSSFPTLPLMYDLQPQMSALGGIRFSSGRPNDQKFQLGFGSSLADLQQPGSFLNSYQPPYDQELHVDTNGIFELPKQVKVEGKNNANGSDGVGIEWQDQDPYNMNQFNTTNVAAAGVHSADSSYLYWSSAIHGGAGWPDIANSSIAPLI